VVEFIRVSCRSLVEEEASEITSSAIESSVQALAKQLLSSQELACSRLRETIRTKRGLLDSSV
jgi:hypothetical protein